MQSQEINYIDHSRKKQNQTCRQLLTCFNIYLCLCFKEIVTYGSVNYTLPMFLHENISKVKYKTFNLFHKRKISSGSFMKEIKAHKFAERTMMQLQNIFVGLVTCFIICQTT